MPKRRSCHRKRKTKIHEVGNGGGEGTACSDRISDLPVDIIHRIICQLPMRDAAKISVLSQRWRSIWASRPIIYLDEWAFGANYFSYTERDKAKRDAFLTYAVKSLDSCEERENNCAVRMLVLRMTAIIFPNELTEMLLPTISDLKNLELRINSSTATSQQILEGFSWILPGLKTLSLTLGSISKLIEFPERG